MRSVTRATVIIAALALTGCATTREYVHRHPQQAAIGAALVVGSIAATASLMHHGNQPQRDVIARQSPCAPSRPGC